VVFAQRSPLHEYPTLVVRDEDREGAVQRAGLMDAQLFFRADFAIVAVDEYDPLLDRQVGDFPPGWTKRQPKRPLMQRLPSVMALSSGDVALTISPSCSWSVSVHPTPQ
jgi:hypothetical protein